MNHLRYLPTFVLLFVLSQPKVYGLEKIVSKVKENTSRRISSSSTQWVRPSGGMSDQKVNSAKEERISRSTKASNFWKNSYCFPYNDSCRSLIKSTDKLLLSDKDQWHEKVPQMFKDAARDMPKQILLFRILRKFVDFYDVPFKAVQVIRHRLDSISSPEKFDPNMSAEEWVNAVKLTQKVYDLEMVTNIRSLQAGAELTNFIAEQNELELGFRLKGKWDPVYQKDILSYWASHRDFYYDIDSYPFVQDVLEIQIVQTNMIQRAHRFPNDFEEVKDVFMKWTQSALTSYSKFVSSFAESIDYTVDDDQTLFDFMKSQFYLQPYGLMISKPSPGILLDQLQIIQFWSSYVHVFLKMKRLGETKLLQVAIDNLVKRNFIETSSIMEQFLIKTDGHCFPEGDPVLAQFLQYFCENTQCKIQRESALAALGEFHDGLSNAST